MDSHVVRMIAEAEQLEDRCDKLTAFIFTEGTPYAKLPAQERALLCKQSECMENYLDVLKERITLAKEQ